MPDNGISNTNQTNWGQAGVQAGLMVGQGIVNNVFAKRNMRISVKAQKELADYSYEKELNSWDMANKYNSPQAQMQRLEEAGLNPALVYGNGAATQSSATLPHYNAPTASHSAQAPQITNSLGQYNDMQLRQANVDQVRAQIRNIEADTTMKLFDIGIDQKFRDSHEMNKYEIDQNKISQGDYKNQASALDELQRFRTLKSDTEVQLNQLRQSQLQIQTMEQNNKLKQYDIDLMKSGGKYFTPIMQALRLLK